MARARQRYDDKFRANAVVTLKAAGYPKKEGALSQVSKHLGVPTSTLHGWASEKHNPVPSDVRTEKKGELARLLRRQIESAIGEMDKALPDASYRDLGTVVGILIDKLQLLSDEPTENINNRIVIEYDSPDSA
mgnify:FL=1